ncbi:MAG: rod shape-determining protein MreD [Burkholderiales bacterium]|jgi:rod shape-determining protein MreD|nr:MAG: rod shape-determining protein MreD [Burkholderiales bacterium]
MKFWRALRTSFALNRPRNVEPVELVSAGGLASGRAAYRPSALLLPARPLFIWGTLLAALLLNLLPAGPTAWVPDFLALVLVFWNVHQPRRVGIGAAFVAGLLMDVHDGALFGEHALAYTLLAYGAITLHRRVLWFPVGAQALHVLALLLLAQCVLLAVRLWVGGGFPGWGYFVGSVVGAAIWPLVSWVLLAPQRRPLERDDTRPL